MSDNRAEQNIDDVLMRLEAMEKVLVRYLAIVTTKLNRIEEEMNIKWEK